MIPFDDFSHKPTSVIGVVLTGGQSSRMKTDKASLAIDGINNLDRAIKLLNNCALDNIVISGHHHIKDSYPNGGPLSGILSVLLSLKPEDKTTGLLVIPVDMPLLTAQLLNKLIEQGKKHNSACCYDSYNLPIYLPITDKLINFLQNEFLSERFTQLNKGPSFKYLLKHIGCHSIKPINTDLLINANTPEQWDKILKITSSKL